MPMSPTAIELPVKELFSSGYLFKIPGYQRPYTWTGQQTREPLDDLLAFLETNPEPEMEDEDGEQEAPAGFLGSIVLIKEKDKPDATVVDGQQRLTTLTPLLSAIRSQVRPAAADISRSCSSRHRGKFFRTALNFHLEVR